MEKRARALDEVDLGGIAAIFQDSKGNKYAELDSNKVMRSRKQEVTVAVGYPGPKFIGCNKSHRVDLWEASNIR